MPSTRRLRLPSELASFVAHLSPAIKRKIRDGLDALLGDPAEGKPLRAELAGLWSLRVGRFRIIYRPQGAILEIVAIGPRETIYQEAGRLMAVKSRFA